jgi:hypothetical protein
MQRPKFNPSDSMSFFPFSSFCKVLHETIQAKHGVAKRATVRHDWLLELPADLIKKWPSSKPVRDSCFFFHYFIHRYSLFPGGHSLHSFGKIWPCQNSTVLFAFFLREKLATEPAKFLLRKIVIIPVLVYLTLYCSTVQKVSVRIPSSR